MNIVFGMQMDGSVWSNQPSAIGKVRTGPNGLLNILESQLGLSKPTLHPALRINEYMDRIKEIDDDTMWFHDSFSADAWSTAKQLLLWRDELVEAGWKSNMVIDISPKLKCLSALENSNLPLSKGRPEGLNEVLEYLKENYTAKISTISLLEPLNILPLRWRNLFNLLRNRGTEIIDYKETEIKDCSSNLKCVQAVISGQAMDGNSLLPNDDSLILLNAANEWDAADHFALWLKSKTEANDKVSIICGMDTNILDQKLKKYGLPSLGRILPSNKREMQQILPLMLANAWKPIDIRLLVELLSLNTSPFPKWVCGYLLRAINKEPGVGGRAWNEAIDKIYDKRKSYLLEENDNNADENSKKYVEEIQSLLVEDRYAAKEGIPEDKLRERCQKVIQLLSWRINEEPMFQELVSHARDIQVLSKGKSIIDRTSLERMLDTVIGAGSISYRTVEEAAPWRVYNHPGQILDSCEEVIWWGFNDDTGHNPAYWSSIEKDALKKQGVILEDSKNLRHIESFDWKNGFLKAKSRFIGISIDNVKGEEDYHHPYWDEILCAAIDIAASEDEDFVKSCIVKNCKEYYDMNWEFAGRKNLFKNVSKIIPMPASPEYETNVKINNPESLSYSQMNTLLGCPFKWVLDYNVRLKLSESQTIPTGNQMIGTLCHRIVEELYKSKKQIDVESAAIESEKLYDSLIISMASELLLEGNSVEKNRYKIAIVNAVKHLVTLINKNKLIVDTLEAKLSGQVESIPFTGYADILLSDEAGNKYILDLKWSSSSKYRKNEIEEGSALQLASYAWMLKSTNKSDNVSTGYFMLAQGKLLSDSPGFTDDVLKSEYSLDEVWKMGVASMKAVSTQLSTGLVEVRGIIEMKESLDNNLKEEKVSEGFKAKNRAVGMLYQKPPCAFCDFGYLCGIEGGAL
ncbi:MAG TPA: PD-(D/E)XK nuclease family protein [Sedimentibacter sp.]|nr:PD-(D/E)XK nuclease family protein [Sedimentibacter sp.]